MKILYLIKSFAMKAGVERVISDKVNWLADHGYEIMLVTYEQGQHSYAYQLHPSIKHEDIGARFFELHKFGLLKRFLYFIKYRIYFKRQFKTIINDFCPDVVVTTTYQLKILDIILSICSNSINIIESHIACYKAQKSSELHGFWLRPFAKMYDAFFLGKIIKFDILVVLTQGDSMDWKKYNRNIRVIPNPVTLFPDSIEEHEERCRIISVGRLHEQKGFDLLIHAFSEISDFCPKWHLDIYGEGDDEKYLRSLISKYGLNKRISIIQPIPNIYEEYMRSDFYVLSSRYEGFPLVLNEAMSCGIPCIAFRCKYGPEDAIIDKVNGLLVENGNVSALAEGMLWMIQHPQERQRMGKAAREAAGKYKKDEIMKKWQLLFNTLCQ